MRQGFMSVTENRVFFTNFYISIRWHGPAGSLWFFISNRILDFLLTSLELVYCSKGHSCCHLHRVKYSIPEASRLKQNCIEWLYVHNAGNINSICWCRAMRSVVKWHEDTREAVFLCKRAGQCKVHYSNKWFIKSAKIYDPMVSQEEESINIHSQTLYLQLQWHSDFCRSFISRYVLI